MDPIQPKFFETSFELQHGPETLTLRGLASEYGIAKISPGAELPAYWLGLLGRVVEVRLEAVRASAVLLQQQVEHGSYYELRFKQIDEPYRRYIQQRVQVEGIDPGWKREFPRIAVNRTEDPSLPVPNLCLVRFVGQEVFASVLNFTLGGLRIETIGDHLAEVRVGAHLNFDLLTSNGDILSNLKAEVRNLSVPGGGAREGAPITRTFGLKFLGMDSANEKKYRQLIRDYCLTLQFRLTGRLG